MPTQTSTITPPDEQVRAVALERLDGLAKPLGALGRLEEVGAWLAACQGVCPPEPVERVRAVVLAGDHGVTRAGVSASPSEVTAAMVHAFVAGVAGVSVLARQHGATVRVLDIGVDADLSSAPADVTAHKLTRSSGSIDVTDAISRDLAVRAIAVGAEIADAEVDAGAQLLVLGDMGIGNTTPSAALIAASLGLDAAAVIGRGTGIDEAAHDRKLDVLARALARACDDDRRIEDPVQRLAALGSADLAVGTGFLVQAARRGVPVLLDGVIACAEALVAAGLAPGAEAWFLAGHRSTEPAQAHALAALGLEPLIDLGMRLGEGSGAMTAVPLVQSAALLVREMALLSDLVGP
ncbi:nicotinate-nucleotide--dimethylbenzimidazole phosphoribosyltransferase [Intrasporangium calvum]|uniref:Nicotinate-nucleotide--dimethylbenzimidazole phosphoribosyltransferase n=1 Tax=Intrasporangium calvum (strain ATCC 23552 / DSM 43043 / JCM 3097 / NBRC 12989 / NCIMB 10167 / NRRL B-3866 / 7 KIP) TaxID=710696 RepID=E6SAH4_INTC7|nr:nicotinate-nucleotide--dimethylbenzimidazole phosphoribosyltransferase [Intrasporangium calvum]ADU47224.1 nicotinate-nucleotide/dimethylbenzimidazolephosp horibosyltransferase [Intrasporangium calvum DSM 43043]